MSTLQSSLPYLLRVAAVLQLGLAIVNLRLVSALRCRPDLERLPLLIREIFYVHCWFISATVAIFGVMTWRFAHAMCDGADPAARWLAAAIGLFWAIRTVLQVTYYSSTHWRGRRDRTAIHVGLLIFYGCMSATYLTAAASA